MLCCYAAFLISLLVILGLAAIAWLITRTKVQWEYIPHQPAGYPIGLAAIAWLITRTKVQ
jgi:hypothetical protein